MLLTTICDFLSHCFPAIHLFHLQSTALVACYHGNGDVQPASQLDLELHWNGVLNLERTSAGFDPQMLVMKDWILDLEINSNHLFLIFNVAILKMCNLNENLKVLMALLFFVHFVQYIFETLF